MPEVIPAALSVRNLTKSYGNRAVLDDVSFSLNRGQRIGLMGPSGSGKSTLLNCIGGIDRADQGEVEIAGKPVHLMDGDQLSELRRSEVSTIFQFFHLLPTLSAAENIEFPLHLIGMPKREREERVASLINEIQLTHRADALPEQLSGGEMQRVAIARALAPSPALILADEPTGNLDLSTGETILDLLEQLSDRHGIALLLVTHADSATRICEATLRLEDGRLV